MTNNSKATFGQLLKLWRKKASLSQQQLALTAGTTPRHLSFIETGRSRPGRSIVLRLGQALDLPLRNRNALLVAAGFAPSFPERDLQDELTQPYFRAVKSILEHHEPNPGAAFNSLGAIVLANRPFRKMFPECLKLSPEQAVDTFFSPGPYRDRMENWAEVAWAWIDRQHHEVARTDNVELARLVERALDHMIDVERPEPSEGGPEVIGPRFRVGDRVITTFFTVMKIESALEIALSELRIELLFPLDVASAEFFQNLG
ncbi:helix-turn-helix domain-containing protein [Rubinisphaera italica]|uniref:Helix-turn-helix protein n=1 Tax=Rubinisphaera italica TaxID=2527969 RepID=A0A5C5XF16_9PLAN|nr:helix-turn-helix domain-containing protein [Rubinisphaera italica]TWT60943.1 helix-turn-helix protein [Rubinisphaera italica]